MSKKNKKAANVQPAPKPVITEYSHVPSSYAHSINWGAIPMVLFMYSGLFIWSILPVIQFVVGAMGFVCSLAWLLNTNWYPYHWCQYSLYLVVSTVTMIEACLRQRNRLGGKHTFGTF